MPDTATFTRTACTPDAPRILGADVAKREVVIHDSQTNRLHRIANDPGALDAALARLGPADLLVCEATGGYERALLAAALARAQPAHRADAARAKAFIASHGGKAKTDPIDAGWLARYGRERLKTLAPWRPPCPTREAIAICMRHRQALLASRTAARNRRSAPGQEAIADLLDAEISFLTGQIETLDARIGELAASSAAIARDERALRAIPGIGPVFARSLIAFIPELGDLSAKAVASLAGLAPHPRESGETARRRHISGGRDGLKSIAFMAALTAARRHPQLAAFYQRLVDAGKPKRLALAAVARKLVVIANAVLKHARTARQLLT